MKTSVEITRFFPLDRFELFDYFTHASLIEQWAYPEGMTLKIPLFEEREGGQYRYEHTASNGVYVCTGEIREFVPGERLVQFDSSITTPDGKEAYADLECVIEFTAQSNGTKVKLTQSGFKTEKDASDCEQGWRESLDHLENLVASYEKKTDDYFKGTDSNIGG